MELVFPMGAARVAHAPHARFSPQPRRWRHGACRARVGARAGVRGGVLLHPLLGLGAVE